MRNRHNSTLNIIFIILLSFISRSSFSQHITVDPPIKIEKEEARKAFEYLNLVRKSPSSYSKEIGSDLGKVKPQHALKWNDILAKVAEDKAFDMAKRNYFEHVTPEGKGINIMIHQAGYKLLPDWIKERSKNFFESIASGAKDGVHAIKMLINDGNKAPLGHRKHLLGMTEFYENCADIGIGFARNPKSKYKTYVSIIIAKQKF
jgi:uncharacterized protein YkwD